MIVSHRHRFIFFAVPKTATHAIRQALAPHLGPNDWQQQALFGKDVAPIPEIAEVGHGHVSARDAKRYLPPEIWNDYLKFAFVRNPFDRFVSTCSFLFRNDERFADAATEILKDALRRPRFRRRVLVRPQVSMLRATDERLAMDFVGRFEDLQSSYEHVCERLGLPVSDLQRLNVSQRGSYADYFDDELANMVIDYYRDDFQALDYATELSPPTN